MSSPETNSTLPSSKSLKQIKEITLSHQRDREGTTYDTNTSAESTGDCYEFLMEIPSANLLLIKEQINAKFLSQTTNRLISVWDSRTFEKINSINLGEYSALMYHEKARCLVASTGYGTLVLYRVTTNPVGLRVIKKIKAYRGCLTQLIEMKNTMLLASFGYDPGRYGTNTIKIWDLYKNQRVATMKVESDIETNIIYIPNRQSFAIVKGLEINIISFRKKRLIQNINIEIYGKKICQQVYLNYLSSLVIIIKSMKEGEYKKHTMMAWRLGKDQPKELKMELNCLNPVLIEEERCVFGSIDGHTIVRYSMTEDEKGLLVKDGIQRFSNAEQSLGVISNKRLIQIIEKKMKVFEY